MNVLASRIILGVETLIICIPLSLLFAYAGLPVMFHDVIYSPTANAWALAVVGIIILATLCCAWVLTFGFLIHGIGRLRSFSLFWWLLPIISGGLSLAVILHLWLIDAVEPSAFNTFGWGVPFVIPLVHLLLERWRRSKTDLSSGTIE
jgi:hypothetical protein